MTDLMNSGNLLMLLNVALFLLSLGILFYSFRIHKKTIHIHEEIKNIQIKHKKVREQETLVNTVFQNEISIAPIPAKLSNKTQPEQQPSEEFGVELTDTEHTELTDFPQFTDEESVNLTEVLATLPRNQYFPDAVQMGSDPDSSGNISENEETVMIPRKRPPKK